MKRLLLIVFLAMPAAAPIDARADDLAAVRSAVEAQYARLDAALARKNPSPFAGVYAADAQIVTADGGEYDLGRLTQAWQLNSATLENLTVRSAVQSIAAEGDAVRIEASAVMEGALTQMGSRAPFRSESTTHETWVKVGTEWLLRRSTEVRSRTWLNGSLIQDVSTSPPLTQAQHDAIVGELRSRAVPFDTVMAGSGFDDLATLDRIVGDARIVALGEATHGTAEFFRMKHRLFEYLVEKKGFTVFAFETNWPAAEAVNRYVRTGEGTAGDALKAIFGVWQTREIRDLVEWMRRYNSTAGRTRLLSFTAFDMQDPETAAKCVTEAVSSLGGADRDRIRRAYDGVGGLFDRIDPAFTTNPLSPDERARFRANAADALELVEQRREALLRVLAPSEYGRARRCATIVAQASMPDADTTARIVNARDMAMADNVRWLAEEAFPGEKIALWAHNGHVAAAPSAVGTHMGQHLRKAFGQQMRVVGFALDRGDVRAKALKQGKPAADGRVALTISAAKAGSPEALLRAAGLPRAILDLRAVPATSPLGAWLAAPQPIRSIGWGYDPAAASASYQSFVLPQAFDVLIFIENTTAAVPLQ